MKNTQFLLCLVFISCAARSRAQSLDDYLNTLSTAVPFLLYTTDAHMRALGDAGTAVQADKNALFNNASKIVFQEGNTEFSANFRKGDDDFYFNVFSGNILHKLNQNNAIGLGFRLHDMGKVPMTGSMVLPDGYLREYAIDAAYAGKLSDKFSIGADVKYINSNLAPLSFSNALSLFSTSDIAADISCFYHEDFLTLKKKSAFTAGVNISNLGGRMPYTSSFQKDYIPANLGLGISYTLKPDSVHQLMITADANKLMVPTPSPVNNNGNTAYDYTEKKLVESWIVSFYDAPGGASEEFHEINYSTGLEYGYKEMFFARGGYFYEHPAKGNRQYFTAGAGIVIDKFDIDFAYIIPAGNPSNPVGNTFAVSIGAAFN